MVLGGRRYWEGRYWEGAVFGGAVLGGAVLGGGGIGREVVLRGRWYWEGGGIGREAVLGGRRYWEVWLYNPLSVGHSSLYAITHSLSAGCEAK